MLIEYAGAQPHWMFESFYGAVLSDNQRRGAADPERIRRLCMYLLPQFHTNNELAPIRDPQYWSLNSKHHGLADFMVECSITDIQPKKVARW